MPKITGLPAAALADILPDDLIPYVDETGPTTKSSTLDIFRQALFHAQSSSYTAAPLDALTTVTASGAILSTGAAGGIGYKTGAGTAITQITSRTTGVTADAICGAITLVSAAGSATPFTFTVTNTSVAALDVVKVCQKSGTDLWQTLVTAVGAGSFKITAFTTGGTTTEQPVFNFVVIKAVAS